MPISAYTFTLMSNRSCMDTSRTVSKIREQNSAEIDGELETETKTELH